MPLYVQTVMDVSFFAENASFTLHETLRLKSTNQLFSYCVRSEMNFDIFSIACRS
jgi:hypothetical protein